MPLVFRALVGFAALCLVVAMCSVQPEERGTTGMYIPVRTDDGYTVAVDLALPRVPANRKWYGVWVMLVDSRADNAPFVQGGLAREEPYAATGSKGRGLAPFVAYRRRGDRGITYVTMPTLPPAAARQAHRFEVGRSGTTLFLRMDGATIFTQPATAVVRDGVKPQVQIAAEVFAYGDTAAGVMSGIRASWSATQPLRPYEANQFHLDRGVCVRPAGDRFIAGGVFRSGGASSFPDRAGLNASACPSGPYRIRRGGGTTSRRPRCVRATRGRATGTCPRRHRRRGRTPSRCGTRRRPSARTRSVPVLRALTVKTALRDVAALDRQ
jgi:hypothetical protein